MAIYIPFIFISFIASLATFKQGMSRPLVFFPFFLFLTSVVEYYGERMSVKGIPNLYLYNFFSSFEFMFYLFVFSYIFKSRKMKKTIIGLIIIYCITAVVNILFIQGMKAFHTYTYMLGCLLVVCYSIFYFNYLLRFPETGSLTRNPYFWIVSGLLFFSTCTFTLFGLNNFFAHNRNSFVDSIMLLSDTLNILLYSSFTIGFLCQIKIRKSYGL